MTLMCTGASGSRGRCFGLSKQICREEKQKGNRELRNHKNETEPESTSHLCTPFTATILSSVARDSKLAAAFNSTKTYGLDGIMAQLIFQNPDKWKEAETKPLDLRSNMGVVPGLDFEC